MKRLLFIKYILLVSMVLHFLPSCKKFVDIDPPMDQLNKDLVFDNDSTALYSLNAIYSDMMNSSTRFSTGGITFYAGLCADELYYYTTSSRDEFTANQITVANHSAIESNFWNPLFKYIYMANACIEGAEKSLALSQNVKNTVLGEAKFIRAFCYFYLVNLFGDVPLITSTDYTINITKPRIGASQIYIQIVNDLKDAKELMSVNYPTTGKVRPNKWTAASLLSRVYLYTGDWVNAEINASDVINSGTYLLELNLDNVFLLNSKEAVWQLLPVLSNINTTEGNQIIPTSNSSSPTYLLTNGLVNVFEPNDQRKLKWAKSRVFASQTLYYPFKYKIRSNPTVAEAYMVFRLAEQYLIRAEARAQLNKINEAQSDLDAIRSRASLTNTTANDKPTLLQAIEQERRVELFAEWGHRWFYLKRTGKADSVLGSLKRATWQSTDVLWPIPQNQLSLNPSLIPNPGY